MRGYYRVPKKAPANRVEGALADLVREKFAEGWPKARIAREFRLNRRTIARICATAQVATPDPPACTVSPTAYYNPFLRERRYFLSPQRPLPAQNHEEQS